MSLPISDATLTHLSVYLSSFSGTDKGLMLLQYFPLVLLPLIRKNGGLKSQQLRLSLQRLSLAVGDGRILFRLFGLVSIVQWYRQVQKKKAAARALGVRETEWLSDARIERIQVWSMLAYYPLEHLYYLASKKVVPLSDQKLNKVGAWSCRFWAAYVVLSLITLARRGRALKKAESEAGSAIGSLAKDKAVWKLQTLVDLSYLPLTAHWSLPAGLWTSSFPTGVFGTLACIGQLQLGWEASRITASPAAASIPKVKVAPAPEAAGVEEEL